MPHDTLRAVPNRPTCHRCDAPAAELVAGKYVCPAHASHQARVARAVLEHDELRRRQQAEYERLALTQRGVTLEAPPHAGRSAFAHLPLEERPMCRESFSSERQYAEALAAAMGFRSWSSVTTD